MADNIQNGFGAQALDIEGIYRAFGGNYVESGVTPSVGTNAFEVDISSGSVTVDGTTGVSVSAQTVTLNTADSDPRKDVVYIDGTGTAQVATGTAAPAQPTGETRRDTYQPQPPDLSATVAVPVAEVWVPGGASDITTGDISERKLHPGFPLPTNLAIGRYTDRPTDAQGQSTDRGRGVEIQPIKDLDGLVVYVSSSTGTPDKIFAVDSSKNIIDEKSGGYTANDRVYLEGSFNSGTTYYIGAYDNDNTYTAGEASISPPISGDYLDITNGAYYIHPNEPESIETINTAYNINDITPVIDTTGL